MSKVTAIISAYFGAEYLDGRLENLFAQKERPEIIVVCQGGSEEHKIALSWSAKPNHRLKIISTENIPTIYEAWNIAIPMAEGEYLTNANCDDRIKNDGLKLLSDALDKHPDYAVAYGNQEIVEKIGGPVVSWFGWATGGFRELLDGCFLGPMPMWRKSLHDKYGLFDGKMTTAGDYEFWLRIAFNHEKFFKVDKVVGVYLRNDKSLERRDVMRSKFEATEARSRYFNQVGDANESVFIGMPTTRMLSTEHVESLITTREFTWIPVKNQPVDVGRNIIVDTFLSNSMKPKYLLFTDSDATWDGKKAVDRLVERDLPMVSGMFFKRDIPPVPTIGPSAGMNESGHALYNFGKTIEKILGRVKESGLTPEELHNNIVLPKSENDLFEIDGCGIHFVLIRRDVLEAVKPPWFQCTAPGAGEDFAFCRAVRAAGFKIYADLSVYSGHIAGDGINLGLRQFLMFYHNTKEINPEEQIWEA